MTLLLIGFGLILAYIVWKDHRAKKAQWTAESAQEPSLNTDDADWTNLDQLALDIARYEALASWQAPDISPFSVTPL